MGLDGVHHVTTITADAPGTVDFWVRVMGLRLVKKTVNFDAPDMYHLYFGDETGSPGSLLTFFEIPGSPPGRAGAGMVHRIVWRVPSAASLDAWAERLGDAGRPVRREDGALVSSDPEGLGIELVVAEEADGAPRAAWAPDIPAEHALAGIAGVRIHSAAPEATERLLVDGLGFTAEGPGRFVTRGPSGAAPCGSIPRRPSAASPARAPCTTWPGRRATRITSTGRAARRGRAPTRRGSSTASTSTRSTSTSPAGCCSRSRPSARGSRWTRSRTGWARSCACRRSTRRIASASRSGSCP